MSKKCQEKSRKVTTEKTSCVDIKIKLFSQFFLFYFFSFINNHKTCCHNHH